MTRKPCVSIGAGGPYEIEGRHAWHFTYLPKGYGPSLDQFVVCTVACPPHENEGKWWRTRYVGQNPELLAVIQDAIEAYFERHPPPGTARLYREHKTVRGGSGEPSDDCVGSEDAQNSE